jgi:hypothetical protein
MKGKYFKYILVLSTLVIWILIGIRIANSLHGNEKIAESNIKIQNLIPIPVVDSFSLQADYPDPFIPTIDSIAAGLLPLVKTNFPHPNTDSVKPKQDYGFIKYVGLISGKSKKSRVAIVNFNGEDLMMKEKDKIHDFTLKKIGKEELVFDTKGKLIKIFKE